MAKESVFTEFVKYFRNLLRGRPPTRYLNPDGTPAHATPEEVRERVVGEGLPVTNANLERARRQLQRERQR